MNKKIYGTPNQSQTEYCTAFVVFLTYFSQIERLIFCTLCHYAEVSKPVGKAIFSGVKVDQSIKHLRRILEVTKKDKSPKGRNLEFVFQQLTSINNVRNDMVHYGPTVLSGSTDITILTNASKALTNGRISVYPMPIETLDDIIHDCYLITVMLKFLSSTKHRWRIPRNWSPPQGLWRYKHDVIHLSQLVAGERKGQHKAQSHVTQHTGRQRKKS